MAAISTLPDLMDLIRRHWGISELRPLQAPAMEAVLAGRDSLVVLPTGGGKSLCYQAPAISRGGTTVVISPLISLMKDQVDGLRSCGISALRLDSTLEPAERIANLQAVRKGQVKLLFVSPERMIQSDLVELLKEIGVSVFAIDEAHCISHWGHDFRPEYRQLVRLRQSFPEASFHAYTATATEGVRKDIIQQLGLRDPDVLVGNFDRANLTYRVLQRRNTLDQVLQVIGRHENDGGIIYCLRRSDVDDLTSKLKKQGIKAVPYHAGMENERRKRAQDAFTTEDCDVVVATVAFGMGIDRSNVRYVLHTAMPKSIEHYQQETGRAGRDGLPAECVLLYSGADFFTWKSIIEGAAVEPEIDPSFVTNSIKHLRDIDGYSRGAVCRHGALVNYFGQEYEESSCGACDLCLGETIEVSNAQVIAQKILSCVARLKERFGINHIVSVLLGDNVKNIRDRGHDQLSTYGLLKGQAKEDVREWIYQLISQRVLLQEQIETLSGHSVPIVRLNKESWEVMRGERDIRLLQPVAPRKATQPTKQKTSIPLQDDEKALFEHLRGLRRQLASERHVPPYIIFSDATLGELSKMRPASLAEMRSIYGVGDAKLREFGELFVGAIADFGRQ